MLLDWWVGRIMNDELTPIRPNGCSFDSNFISLNGIEGFNVLLLIWQRLHTHVKNHKRK